ncbi:MAG: metal ABC transporter permease [candidate division Zixibacteria bacterium]|nr:metal ABC transporter permease [candidate division Zixibacteria bacterium]
MLWPVLACIVLTGIHVYFGAHVIRRGVIFVDLSLAQVAAFGSTVAFLFGLDLESVGAYFISLAFALVGAVLFALARKRESEIPQEAIIGIVYAVATAAAILAVARQPEGAEHIKALLIGSVLTVTPLAVGKTAVLYALIGFLHWHWRKPMWQITADPEAAKREGLTVRLWDFLFYGSFAFVVTSSVRIVGVLLVFALLVVPGTAAILAGYRNPVSRLIFGWIFGVIVCVAGMALSYFANWPPGATIVALFGASLLVTALVGAAKTA